MWSHVFKLAALCAPIVIAAFERAQEPQTYSGKVLVAGEGKLVLTMGTEQLTFLVTNETKITLDGAPAGLEKLASGYSAQVKGERSGEHFTAIAITARAEAIVEKLQRPEPVPAH